MDAVISAVERIYQELARPAPISTTPTPTVPATHPELDRDQVQAILQRKRSATIEELQSISNDSKEYGLSRSDRDQLSVDLTMRIAQARQPGSRSNPNERFIAQVLRLVETPFGLVDRIFAEELLRAGSENIYRCKRHQPPRCGCWCAQRALVWQVLGEKGEKSAEGWAAMRIYALLEELECSEKA